MAKKVKNITEREYRKIKLFIEAELTNSQIAKLTGRSASTVARIRKSETLEEFRRAQREDRYSYSGHPTSGLATPVEPQTNDTKFIGAMVALTQAIDRLTDLLDTDTPLEKEGKIDRLFRRAK